MNKIIKISQRSVLACLFILIIISFMIDINFVSKMGNTLIYVDETTSSDDECVFSLLAVFSVVVWVVASLLYQWKYAFLIWLLCMYGIQCLILNFVSFDTLWNLVLDTVRYGESTSIIIWLIVFLSYTLSVLFLILQHVKSFISSSSQ